MPQNDAHHILILSALWTRNGNSRNAAILCSGDAHDTEPTLVAFHTSGVQWSDPSRSLPDHVLDAFMDLSSAYAPRTMVVPVSASVFRSLLDEARRAGATEVL